MSITQHFIVEGKYLGAVQRNLERVHNTAAIPQSYAFFCPECGDVWARCPVTFGTKQQSFLVWRISCRKHDSSHYLNVPGSLHMAWDKPFSEAFPEEVLWRELAVHLDHAEKKGYNL
jgi:hypothetical protein